MNDIRSFGWFFETMAVRDLRVYADAIGGNVSHFLDRNGLECDAVVHLRNGASGLVEIKLGGERLVDEGARSLARLTGMIDTARMKEVAFRMVLTATGEARLADYTLLLGAKNFLPPLRKASEFGILNARLKQGFKMDATKENIMAAAMRLFAEKGLKLVTVREICTAAKVNIALVNYHFHNKNGLYQACVERLFRENTGDELCTTDATVADARSWRAAVRKWIFGFSRGLRSTKGGTALVAGFFRQEVVHPSPMCDLVRERYVIPVRDCLLRLVAMAVEDVLEQRRWVESIWAQLSSYALVDASWHPVFRPVDAAVDVWGDSIADFVYRQVVAGMKYRAKRGAR